jgi:hypothetical protein
MRDKEIGSSYLDMGLNPIPLKEKIPLIKGWEKPRTREEVDTFDYTSIGICTGVVSGGLEAIDFDLKYHDEPAAFLQKWKDKVGVELLKKLTVQSTINKGYHFIYRCPHIEPNKIIAKNKKGEVLIETRGEGGFIKCYPSEGYKMIQGSFDNIPIITPLERNKLMSAAYFLDEEVYKNYEKRKNTDKFNKFPKYDSDPEIALELLEKHGWKIIREAHPWIELRRPDKTEGLSAGYNLEGNFLYVHTTSTVFQQRQPYNNYAIYAELEHDGDYVKAYKELNQKGFGTVKSGSRTSQGARDNETIEKSLDDLSFISTKDEEDDFLLRSLEDRIPLGLPTGWSELDEYFRFKENSFNMGLGYDGVGKSLLTLSLAGASNVQHNWKWGMVLPENKTAMSRRRLIECMTGQEIKHMDKDLFNHYREKTMTDFKIVSNKQHYSLLDVIDMGKRLFDEYGIKALLVDPWNFFKVGEGVNDYKWNNRVLSEFRVFAEKYCSVYIMAHPSSESPRKNKDEKGFLKPPTAYEIQGGADFPYRVDDFFIFHRILNHPSRDIKTTLQFIMHKVKEEETGGARHSMGEYTPLKWGVKDGFLGYWDEANNNPMYEAFKKINKTKVAPEKPDDVLFKFQPKKLQDGIF